MPIPTDSLVSAAERRAKMQAEAAERAKQRDEAEQRRKVREEIENAQARKDEDEWLRQLPSDKETRDHLLARVQSVRDAGKPEPPKTMPLTEAMKRKIELEQEAGRAAVAKHQAELDLNRAAREAAKREDEAREGHMTPVYQGNPQQTEAFPVQKASFK